MPVSEQIREHLALLDEVDSIGQAVAQLERTHDPQDPQILRARDRHARLRQAVVNRLAALVAAPSVPRC